MSDDQQEVTKCPYPMRDDLYRFTRPCGLDLRPCAPTCYNNPLFKSRCPTYLKREFYKDLRLAEKGKLEKNSHDGLRRAKASEDKKNVILFKTS